MTFEPKISQVLICIFGVFIWNFRPIFYIESQNYFMRTDILQLLGPLVVTSHIKTLNCDISSLEDDTEMVDHSTNPKFPGAFYKLIMLHFN